MKTIICEKPGEMSLQEQPNPTTLNENEVMIAIKRIGICGTDIHAYGGKQPFFEYPRILGHELSGTIAKTGKQVQKVSKDDYVTVIPYIHCGNCIACKKGKTNCCTDMKVTGVHVDGGMCEFLVLPESQVIKVEGMTLDEAAVVEPLSIGAHGVRRAGIKADETVLIIGAGPIGMGVAKFAKLQGAKTIIMDINEERLAYCQKWTDSDFVLTPSDFAVEKILEMNDGNLPSVVMDATGNKQSMMNAFDYVSHGGKLVYVGLVKDTISFNDPNFHSKELTLMGSRNANLEDFEYVIQCMEEKKLDISSYITHYVSFDHVCEYLKSNNFNTNKALITLEKDNEEIK